MGTVGWVVLVICAMTLVGAASLLDRRGGRAALRRRFGPEYDRVVAERGGRRAADRYLTDITERRDALTITTLSENERKAFTDRWTKLQSSFVDDPVDATSKADFLVTDVLRSRGYPADSFDECAELLGADHPRLVGSYREARRLATVKSPPGSNGLPPDTERLRSAFVRYRELFGELVGAGAAGARTGAGRPG